MGSIEDVVSDSDYFAAIFIDQQRVAAHAHPHCAIGRRRQAIGGKIQQPIVTHPIRLRQKLAKGPAMGIEAGRRAIRPDTETAAAAEVAVKIAEAGKVAARAAAEGGIAGPAEIAVTGAKIPAVVAAIIAIPVRTIRGATAEIPVIIAAITEIAPPVGAPPLRLLWRGLELRCGLRASLAAAILLWEVWRLAPHGAVGIAAPGALALLALVRLMALNLIREIGGPAMRRGLRLRLRWRGWSFPAGAATVRTAMFAAAMTVPMFLARLGKCRCCGQSQDSNGYQQAAHVFLPRDAPT